MIQATNQETGKWFPVCTNPRAEKKAFQALLDKGIQVYLPLQRKLKRWSDRKKWVEEPFIRSYLFVYIKPEQLADVLKTKGISRFIYFSGKIASMPESQINDLRMVLASSYELEVTEENLLPGERIVIKAGSLKGMTGEIISYRSQRQLVLKLESLGCSIIVHVASAMIDRL